MPLLLPAPQTKFQVSPAPGGVPCRIIRRGNYTPEHRANFRLRSRSGFQPLSFGTKRQGCRFYYPARLSPQTKFQASPAPGCVFCRIIRRGNYTPEHRTNFRLRSRSGFQPLSFGTKRQGCRFYYPRRKPSFKSVPPPAACLAGSFVGETIRLSTARISGSVVEAASSRFPLERSGRDAASTTRQDSRRKPSFKLEERGRPAHRVRHGMLLLARVAFQRQRRDPIPAWGIAPGLRFGNSRAEGPNHRIEHGIVRVFSPDLAFYFSWGDAPAIVFTGQGKNRDF